MRRMLLGGILLVVLCAGCDSSRSGKETVVAVTVAPTASQTTAATAFVPTTTSATMFPTPPLDRLNDAEQTWQASGVTNYQLRAHFVAEVYVDGVIDLKVENGQITSATCIPQPKSVDLCSSLRSEDYTIPGLFQKARRAMNDPTTNVIVQYDATYGFPRSVMIQSRTSTGGSDITVEDFAHLP